MSDTKKPDLIFAHHSVVRERPQQESSATTAKKCSIEGCGGERAVCAWWPFPGPYCEAHEASYGAEWSFCVVRNCFNPRCKGVDRCARHGGQDYTPRTTADHPSSATTASNYKREGFTHCGVCDQILPHLEKCIPRAQQNHPNPAPPEANPCDDGKEENTPARLPCIVCGVPLGDKTPSAREWSFTSRMTGAEKRGLCHEACIATMETILKKEATI
jgi:hypothetical protein